MDKTNTKFVNAIKDGLLALQILRKIKEDEGWSGHIDWLDTSSIDLTPEEEELWDRLK